MSNTGIINAGLNTVINPADRQKLVEDTAPRGIKIDKFKPGILTLNSFETKCLIIQLGNIESNTNSNLVSTGVPTVGTFRANINANTVVSHANTYFSNIATVTITNSDHANIKIGMVANITSPSTGAFGSNTMVILKSIGGNITAGNFVPGFTYTITSLGSTDFTLCGLEGNVANIVIGNVFVANSVGTGTGTAFLTNNQIMLGSNHTVSGDILFNTVTLSLGRYQNSDYLLTKYGYKNNDGTWATKDGIDSNEVFLQAIEVQNSIMNTFVQEQYVELIKAGAIREGDSKEIIAGMLALAYQYHDINNPLLNYNVYNSQGTINFENFSPASRANLWRTNGQTVDSRERPGHIYFNGGRYAISTLGADVPE